jgi:DtxR family Mn-dependent transcriptional regulator
MDAALGYPASDPHGDPIPTSEGMLRVQQENAPIATLNRGERGKIVHLEDEPPVAYAQLLAEGLHIGQTVSIIETSAARIVFSNGEREVALAPGIAANVFVQQLEQTRTRQEGVLPLSKLKSKESAEVIELDERCQGFTRRRFLDLGLTPGTTIAVELDNAFREPRAYRVRSTLIALRKEQADLIWVRPDAGDGKA